MPLRAFLFFSCLCIAISACKNEPYDHPPLGVVGLINHETNVNNTYKYHDLKLFSFLSMATDTVTWMLFHYSEDQLQSIVSDSSATSRKVSSFYRSGDVVTDTTYVIDANGSRLISARAVTYDAESNPTTVDIKTWTDAGITEELAELTWEDGNVLRLVTYNLVSGEKANIRDRVIGHDQQSCVYMRNPDYLYTLALKDLFWLSTNNPNLVNDGSGDKKYQYWYNKLGYPSNFKSETGVLYGVSYTQVR